MVTQFNATAGVRAGEHPCSVSVVIPAYNAAATIAETIGSILQQSRPPEDIIVVNDGSTDGTAAVLERFGTAVTVITQPNGGLARARNAGCQAAKGDAIAIIDADDLAHRSRLHIQLSCLQSDPAIVLTYSDFSAFNDAGEVEASHIRTYYSALREAAHSQTDILGAPRMLDVAAVGSAPAERVQIRAGNIYEHLAHGNFVHPPTMMFRRDLFAKAGPFDPQFRNGSDWDWIVRASRHGTFAFIDAPLLAYRLSAHQMSGQAHRRSLYADTVSITEAICARDPQLFARDRARFKRELARRYVDLADALADHGDLDAIRKLVKAAGHNGVQAGMLRVLAKALLPKAAVRALRRSRGPAEPETVPADAGRT